MLNIVVNPNQILRKKAEKIKDPLSSDVQKLIPEMIETMLVKDGIGLAAPQIGKSIRIVVIHHKDRDLVMINPKIVRKSLIKEWDEEGCLSVPEVFGDVKRCKKITVKYIDESGKEQILSGEGLLARVIQHEVDHLDGVLFIDKAKNLRRIENE
ncbi:MAG: Peptide deformylase [Parcubacteria group bacterium ADurb.Bin326]|nr:MAG: Peptide deformylase [Parcubacteria group bacterium ADurb.Bin326]